MEHLLDITFYDDNTKANMNLLGIKFGPYTLSEKFIQQIAEFYNDRIITLSETKYHIDNFLKKSALKSNIIGGFSIFFKIYKILPDVDISLSPKVTQKANIHFAFIENTMKYGFILKNNNADILLSSFFEFKQEAYDFVNFLYTSYIITNEEAGAFEKLIKDSFLFDGNKLVLLN